MRREFASLSYWKQRFSIAKNLIYAVLASVLNNFALQFLLYPAIERQVGEERYGEILVFVTIANVCGLSFGGSANTTYLTSRKHYKSSFGDFFIILAVTCAGASALSVFLVRGYLEGPFEALLLALLITLTVYHSYSFLEYQLRKDYSGYFLFMVITVCVSAACIPLLRLTGSWAVLLLPGFAAGIIYVWKTGRIFRGLSERSGNMGRAAKDMTAIGSSYLLNYGAQNADRFLLLPLIDGTAVTYYYVASLFSKTLAMVTGPINNLILSYLSEKNKPLDRKTFSVVTLLIAIVCALFLAAVMLIGPWMLRLPFLYPQLVDSVMPYMLLASLGQLLVIGSSIIVTLDLLVAPNYMQVLLQGLYLAAYVCFTVPLTVMYGLNGFVIATCAAGAVRCVAAFLIGWIYINRCEKGGGLN